MPYLAEKEGRAPKREGIGIGLLQPVKGMPGRNDACPCGSGKKFKKCCGQ